MKAPLPEVRSLSSKETEDLLKRAETGTLTPDDVEVIRQTFETLAYIITLLHQKKTQIKMLLKRIFGIKSEKSQKLQKQLKKKTPDNPPSPFSENETETTIPDESAVSGDPSEEKQKGHGRNPVDAYTGAQQAFIGLQGLRQSDKCPECLTGKVYRQTKPGVFIHIEGQAPLAATVYQLEKYRCNLCGEIFQAELPAEVAGASGSKRYDETAKSIMAILRYGSGLPLNRLSELQNTLGVPLPVSTGWDKTEEAADLIYPVYEELKRQAAQGGLIHNDDTGMKILAVMKEIAEDVKNNQGKTRTGIFTTGMVSIVQDQKIVLFFTGRRHAGENFADLLEKRETDLGPPIQMSDAKSGNTPENADVISSYCNTHARRNFVNVADDFPDQCLYVIVDVFGKIYQNDAQAKKQQMSADERLQYHRKKSGPVMEMFYTWLNDQFEQKLVEPNSSLGKAITYVLNHWDKLSRFLQVPGVPLDNNICERALKKAILHRKNSLFYQTEHGAYLGDMFMSLIHTCNLAGKNPFDYLTHLQIHSAQVFKNPERWLPWNYEDTLTTLTSKQPVPPSV